MNSINNYFYVNTFKLDTELSSYLNFLRFFAAFIVLLGHMEQFGLYMAWLPLAYLSHEAVIIFFVMSGLIIYWTTANKYQGLKYYCQARASRIYSVAFPAVLFCSILSLILSYVGNVDVAGYRPFSWLDIASSLLFLNEMQNNPADLSLNGAYWSLCYEVWYYAIFGLYFFFDKKNKAVLLFLVLCIFSPGIASLFPIWLAGALVAKGVRLGADSWSHNRAFVIFFGSVLLIFVIKFLNIDAIVKVFFQNHIPGFWRLAAAQRVFTDYIVCFLIILNILAFDRLHTGFRKFFSKYKNVFESLAGFSFTLYLFHFPMVKLIAYYFPNTDKSIFYSIVIAVFILFSCFVISYGTERRLKWWKKVISQGIA